MRRLPILGIFALTIACGGSETNDNGVFIFDAGFIEKDSGVPVDTGVSDASIFKDALPQDADSGTATTSDGGLWDGDWPDAAETDAAPYPDAAITDAQADASIVDSSFPDADPLDGEIDSGQIDSGVFDTGFIDTGPKDADAEVDAEVDSGPKDLGFPDSGVPPDSGLHPDATVPDAGNQCEDLLGSSVCYRCVEMNCCPETTACIQNYTCNITELNQCYPACRLQGATFTTCLNSCFFTTQGVDLATCAYNNCYSLCGP